MKRIQTIPTEKPRIPPAFPKEEDPEPQQQQGTRESAGPRQPGDRDPFFKGPPNRMPAPPPHEGYGTGKVAWPTH